MSAFRYYLTLAIGDGSRCTTCAELADTKRDPAIRALEHVVEGRCEQLEDANQRAERAQPDSHPL